MSRCKHCSKVSQVPGPSLFQFPFTEHLGGLLAHRMKFKLHRVAGGQGFHPGASASPARLVILITPCSPDPKSSTSPTSQACMSPTDCLLSSLSLGRPPCHALLKPSPASLCWMLPSLARTQAGRSKLPHFTGEETEAQEDDFPTVTLPSCQADSPHSHPVHLCHCKVLCGCFYGCLPMRPKAPQWQSTPPASCMPASA